MKKKDSSEHMPEIIGLVLGIIIILKIGRK